MAVFVPIQLEEQEGQIVGRFSFDPGYQVQGRNRLEAATKLHRAIAGCLQNSKDPAFVRFLQNQAAQSQNSLIRVDLLSQAEKAWIFLFFGFKLVFIGVLLTAFLTWLSQGQNFGMELTQTNAGEFLKRGVMALYLMACVFLTLMLILRRTFLEWFFSQYELALLASDSLRRVHLGLFARWANCFQSKSYEYRGSLA